MSPRPSPRRQAPIRYAVSMPEPVSHELYVVIDVPEMPARDVVDLVFPAWAPGSYLVRDFVRHVYDLEITDEHGRVLASERIDKQRWRVRSDGQQFRVTYRVFAFEQTVRTSFLDDTHAFWNGTSLFFFIDGEIDRPAEVAVEVPHGWHISTALPPARRPHTYRASSYDELVDAPFEVGTHRRLFFRVGATRFEVALYGRTNASLERLTSDLKRIVTATGKLFGGFPFERYVFIIHALTVRGGGLEHAGSSTLDIAGFSFEEEKGYQSFAELAAHEFFHAWNVKRIHDRVLGPFDYTRENYTRMLWFHEGFTEYMESIILLRAGLVAPKRYLEELGETWGRYSLRPGRNVTPLSELSFEAWIKLYKPADNHTNRTVSYYEKGKWAALVLDLMLLQSTGGKRGLADLFKRLWRDFGERARGLTTADVKEAAEAIADKSLKSYFDRYIDGIEELPVPALLARSGIEVERRAAWADEEDPVKARRLRGWSGLTFAANTERATVRNVVPDSPAWEAGLTFGDEIVSVNDVRVTSATAPRRLADRQPGETARVAFFRQDALRTTSLTLADSPERKWEFALEIAVSGRSRTIRRGWLGV